MTRVSLNKNALKRERDRLKLFRSVLPSLDLKRQQLAIEAKKARAVLAEVEGRLGDEDERLQGLFEIVGEKEMPLEGLLRTKEVVLGERNVVGTRLPVVESVTFERASYSTLAKPFWVDFLVEALERLADLRLQHQVARESVRRLDAAARRTTQRVNLFEKRLIPEARANIKRIGLTISEQERSAVVRSKLAKRKG